MRICPAAGRLCGVKRGAGFPLSIKSTASSSTQQLGYRAGALDVDALVASVPGIDRLARIESQQPFALDSAALELSHW